MATDEPVTHRFERTESAASAGALLRAIGTDLERGTTLRISDGDEVVTVDPPAELDVEVEVESVPGDDGHEIEVEVELGWTGPAAVGVEAASDDYEDEEGDDPWEAEGPAAPGAVDSKATFDLYKDRASEWRWRLRHDNGNIIADSGEGYSSLASARTGMRSVMRNAPGADIEREE